MHSGRLVSSLSIQLLNQFEYTVFFPASFAKELVFFVQCVSTFVKNEVAFVVLVYISVHCSVPLV